MASDVELGASALEASRLRLREINAVVTLTGNVAVANIVNYTDNTNIQVYVEKAAQPVPAPDTGCNFPTLDSNAAPAVVGFCVLTGANPPAGVATQLIDVRIPTIGIVSSTMTAGVFTPASKYGLANTGVTASGNLAFIASLTGLDLDAGDTATFPIIITYLTAGGTS